MHHGVGKKRADSNEDCRQPTVRIMAGEPRPRDSHQRKDGQQPGFRCNQEMTRGRLYQLTLHHEKEARGAGLDGFVPSKHHAELMFFVKAKLSFYGRGYESTRSEGSAPCFLMRGTDSGVF